MFSNTELLDKSQDETAFPSGMHLSCYNRANVEENRLLSDTDRLKLSMDNIQLANPLGKDWRFPKLCPVYWFLAKLPNTH